MDSYTCFTCKRVYTEVDEIEFMQLTGECSTCDHVRGEIYAEQISEHYDEDNDYDTN